jgi:uncharacterized protein (UPF0335 family)
MVQPADEVRVSEVFNWSVSPTIRRIEEESEAIQQRWREWANRLRSVGFTSSLISEATANSMALLENGPAT